MTQDTKLEPCPIRAALGLFASAIKSGEPWTEHCQQAFDEALAALNTRTDRAAVLEEAAQVAHVKGNHYRNLANESGGLADILNLKAIVCFEVEAEIRALAQPATDTGGENE